MTCQHLAFASTAMSQSTSSSPTSEAWQRFAASLCNAAARGSKAIDCEPISLTSLNQVEAPAWPAAFLLNVEAVPSNNRIATARANVLASQLGQKSKHS